MERYDTALHWATLLLVGCFVLLAVTKALYPRRFLAFAQLPVTNRFFYVQAKNEALSHPFTVLLFVAQVISVTLFFYVAAQAYLPEIYGQTPLLYLRICTLYVAFVFIKVTIEKIMGAVFNIETLVNQYLIEKITYRNLIALLFFVLDLILLYVLRPHPAVVVVFLAVVVILNCISLVSSYRKNATVIKGNLFYFILYLCTLEISPYIILYKAFA